MNNVTEQMKQAETGDTEEMGNFSYNEDALGVSSSSAVDQSNCGSVVLFSMVCSSNSEGMI